MKKIFIRTALGLVLVYVAVCLLVFFSQEGLIFHPARLNASYRFQFDQVFEEKTIRTKDGTKLNGILFHADSAKGLVFFLHGNGGCLQGWGQDAPLYTQLGYDVFMLDYRGYGKSEGNISSQEQLFGDVQAAYDELKRFYPENKIVLMGYSIGTGPAAKLASANAPRLLVLHAPYYSLGDLAGKLYSVIPGFLLKYKLETYRYLGTCNMPVTIFHGDADRVIYYGSSLKLQKEFKTGDTLITLRGESHNGILHNSTYQRELKKLLP